MTLGSKWEIEKDCIMRTIRFTGIAMDSSIVAERALIGIAIKYIEDAHSYGGLPLVQDSSKKFEAKKGKIILYTEIIFPDASSLEAYSKNVLKK